MTPNSQAPSTTVMHREAYWYKDAVIYQLHVRSFFDANGDGIGDLKGLLSKLDYIVSLGVNTVWLLPFYPSPRRDDGYDIAEYRDVDTDYGSLADVRRFIREAHKRGVRVITELVVNHTSDQHKWFQRARHAKKGSVARNYYVWSDDDRKYAETRIIFCDTEKSNWTWDPVAGAYYWHRFFSHQPDLNYDNPHVMKAMLSIMRYWLDIGVDGLRLDAVPYLVEREGTSNENLPETHAVLRRIRAVLDAEYPDRLLLAEANQWPEDAQEYFGNGDECHMAFHFPLMPRMYMAIARADRFPITDIMRQTPEIPENCQWATFLRNHDELTLEMVTSKERDYLWEVYASDRRARINLGIRRRLAPLLERDRRRIELMTSLLLSMPGTPVLYYGDEIGMGDNIHLGDRDGVRTPMQWSPDRNGGFSRADPERLSLPPIMGPLYGYEAVNVEAQQRDPYSLLNWNRKMLSKRQQTRVFGRGTLRFLFPGNRHILAYLREYENTVMLCVANLSDASQPVELDLRDRAGHVPLEVLGATAFPTISESPYMLTLPPYGFYWFELSAEAQPPSWHASPPEQQAEYTTLVFRRRTDHGYQMLDGSRRLLESEILPRYLLRQRWFTKSDPIDSVRILYILPLPGQSDNYLCEIEVTRNETPDSYFLPLKLWWTDVGAAGFPIDVIAWIRRGADTGVMTDAFFSTEFVLQLLELIRGGCELVVETKSGNGMIYFQPELGLAAVDWPDPLNAEHFLGEQSNSSVVLGSAVVLKLIRRVVTGIHPDVEMARHLSRCDYANVPQLLGEMQCAQADGAFHTLAVVHEHIDNQGNAWDWTLDYLNQTLDQATFTGETRADYSETLKGYGVMAATIGCRLAQLHAVLSRPSDDPSFQPAVADRETLAAWSGRVKALFDDALRAALISADTLTELGREHLDSLRRVQSRVNRQIDTMTPRLMGTPLIRLHGDLHLGQMLVSQNDIYFIDFEGEPLQPMHDRRLKSNPWRDVAGVLRSFAYAAALVQTPIQGSTVAAIGTAEDGTPLAPGSAALQEHRHHLLDEFRAMASTSFLDAYRVTRETETQPEQILHADHNIDAFALSLALVEKAAYEVIYELHHRPDWVIIALSGLREVTQDLLVDSTGVAS